MFEIKTRILNEAVADLRHASTAIRSGAMPAKEANALINSADKTRRAVETDLRVRLAAPKLAEIEGKQEQE